MSTVAKRYAPALLDVARESGDLEAVLEDVNALSSLIASSPEFSAFLQDPLIPADKQDRVIDALFETKLSPVTVTFLRLLVRQDRLAALPEILDGLAAMLDDQRDILEVSVRTAVSFTAAQASTLKEKLQAKFGKTIRLSEEVDESLLGGFLIRTGDLIEDYSLLAKLARFKQNIINA
jgi:F-type H+-transporting ATPase subunit delta